MIRFALAWRVYEDLSTLLLGNTARSWPYSQVRLVGQHSGGPDGYFVNGSRNAGERLAARVEQGVGGDWGGEASRGKLAGAGCSLRKLGVPVIPNREDDPSLMWWGCCCFLGN